MAPRRHRLAVLAAHLRGRSAAEPTAQRQRASASPEGDAVPEHWRLSQMPAGPTGPRTRLTEAEKRQFYEDVRPLLCARCNLGQARSEKGTHVLVQLAAPADRCHSRAAGH